MNAVRAVVRPPITPVERIQVLYVSFKSVFGKFGTILLQAEVCENSEPQPVSIGHARSNQS